MTTIAIRPGCWNALRRGAVATRPATIGSRRVRVSTIASEANAAPRRGHRRRWDAAVAGSAGTVDPMAISGVADLTGRVLAGRYRLLAPIGAGASGRVYVADDVRLRRRVAVKVLHAALADDAGFLRRFRAEAQVAASLHHPNVMAVYDWGEDDVPFMVLELLTGREPARPARRRRPPARPSQAAHVGRQVTARARVRARARARAPRHQAREPALRRARHRPRRRLRPRACAGRGELDRAGRRGGRHRALRGAGAGHRRAARRSRRPLLARGRAGRGGHRHGPRGRRHRDRHARGAHAHAAASRRSRSVGSGRSSSAPADPIPPSAIPTPPPCAPRSPTRRVRSPPPQPLALAGLGGEIDGSATRRRSARCVDHALRPGRTRRRRARRTRRAGSGARSRGAVVRRAPCRWVSSRCSARSCSRWSAGGVALAAAARGHRRRCRRWSGSRRSRRRETVVAGRSHACTIVERSADDPAGVVIGQQPAPGDVLGDDADVELVVSRGPPPVAVPDVTDAVAGRRAGDARGRRVRRRT